MCGLGRRWWLVAGPHPPLTPVTSASGPRREGGGVGLPPSSHRRPKSQPMAAFTAPEVSCGVSHILFFHKGTWLGMAGMEGCSGGTGCRRHPWPKPPALPPGGPLEAPGPASLPLPSCKGGMLCLSRDPLPAPRGTCKISVGVGAAPACLSGD